MFYPKFLPLGVVTCYACKEGPCNTFQLLTDKFVNIGRGRRNCQFNRHFVHHCQLFCPFLKCFFRLLALCDVNIGRLDSGLSLIFNPAGMNLQPTYCSIFADSTKLIPLGHRLATEPILISAPDERSIFWMHKRLYLLSWRG